MLSSSSSANQSNSDTPNVFYHSPCAERNQNAVIPNTPITSYDSSDSFDELIAALRSPPSTPPLSEIEGSAGGECVIEKFV